MKFDDDVRQHIQERLKVEYLLDQIQYGLLRDIVEECFLLESDGLSNKEKAIVILNLLFLQLVPGYSFSSFVAQLDDDEQNCFLSQLLYYIYYLNITLEHLVSPEKLECYLFCTLAYNAEDDTIKRLYGALDEQKKRVLLAFCLLHFDEGAYRILQHAQDLGNELVVLADRKIVANEEAAYYLLNNRPYHDAVEEKYKQFAKIFGCSDAEGRRFCQIFGIYDHQVPKELWDLHEYSALTDKLEHMPEKNGFKEAIAAHIDALTNHQERYSEGVESITYALPTAGKELSKLAWLKSMVRAVDGFCRELQYTKKIPLFIFDQSNSELFSKNRAYINSLSADCIHLGTAQVLQVAKRLEIQSLFETDDNGRFGFGGARNAIFLLMPLFKHYYTLSKEIEKVSDDELKSDFEKIVRKEEMGPCIIHMGDDDVHVPYSTLFSDALFAWQHKGEYFCRFGWVKGRKTTWTETSFNLEYILERTPDILLQHTWHETPFRHGMAGLLSKPKLCLNVPFGQEEAYLMAMCEYLFDLRHPMLHLSGYRFPKEKIPTNRFSGLATFLRGHFSYSVGSMLVSDLLDPLNFYHRCCLPWNMRKTPFTSLQDAVDCITADETIRAMQQGFKKNMQYLAQELEGYKQNKYKESDLAIFHLGVLEVQDVDVILAKYARFTNEVAELKMLFTDLTLDARCFKELLTGSNKEFPEDRLPITHDLKLLQKVITTASFQRAIAFAK